MSRMEQMEPTWSSLVEERHDGNAGVEPEGAVEAKPAAHVKMRDSSSKGDRPNRNRP